MTIALVCAIFAFFGMAPNPLAGESLEQAWDAALMANPHLQAGRWRVSAASRGMSAAQAERRPSTVVGATYTVRDRAPAYDFLDLPPMLGPIALPESLRFQQREGFVADVRLRQPVYTFGRITSDIRAASAAVALARAEHANSVLQAKMDVAVAYVTVLRARRNLEVAEMTFDSLQAHKRDVRNRMTQGRAIRNELLAAQVALANARQQVLGLGNDLNVAHATYNRAVGRPLEAVVEIEELTDEIETRGLADLTRLALGRRPELERLSAMARTFRHQAASIRAANLPQVTAESSFQYEENRFLATPAIVAAGVGVQWKPYDSGRSRHKAARLSQAAHAVCRDRKHMESLVSLEVRKAWLDLETTRQQVKVNEEAVEQAEENLRVAKNLYGQGRAAHTEVLDAEVLRSKVYRNYHTSVYEVVLANLRLRRATGEL